MADPIVPPVSRSAVVDTVSAPLATTPVPTVANVPAPTPQSVYSSSNIAQTAVQPVQAVNPALEDYNAYMNSPEMIEARNNVANITNQINSEKAGLRNTTTGLEYQNEGALGSTGASINLIGTQVGRASQLSSNRQAALGEQLQGAVAFANALETTKRDQYNIIQGEKDKIQSLIAQTGGQAGITKSDTFETATQKAWEWEKKEKKKIEDKAKKDSESEEKKTLQTQIKSMGGSTKTKNGGTMNLKQLKAEWERLSGEKYKKDESRSDEEWKMKVATFNKSMSGSSGSSADIKTANENYIYSGLSSAEKGTDGFVDPSVWKPAFEEWKNAGGSASDFVKLYGGVVDKYGKRVSGFINPKDL